MLGNRSKTPDSHMERIKDILRTTFQALPKNKEGKLERCRRALHIAQVLRAKACMVCP